MDLFLIFLALVWLVIASYLDLKKREIPNWLSFSLIVFALAYRAFYAFAFSDSSFILNGLIGFGIFFLLGNLFYYARVFAGGDAKLLMALGVILPFPSSFIVNLFIFALFVFLLMLSGSVYGLIYSSALALQNKKKFYIKWKNQFRKYRKIFKYSLISFFLLLIFVLILNFYLNEIVFFALPFLILLYPILLVYAKSVEESCMIKAVDVKDLTEGDWLYQKIKVGRRQIKPYWEGLSLEEVRLLRKRKGKVLVKQGIPFVPSFLIAFLFLILLLRYSSWSFL